MVATISALLHDVISRSCDGLSCVESNNRKGIESGDGISLGPQPNSPSRKAVIAMVNEFPIIQPCLETITSCRDLKLVPLPKRGRSYVRGREHATPAVVVVKSKIVLECVGAHH